MRPTLILPLIAVLLLGSCDDPNANRAKALQNEIDQLQRTVVESQQTAKRLEVQVQAARDERKKLEDDKAKAVDQKSKAEEELQRMKEEFNAYKSKYKVSARSKIPGLQLQKMVVNAVAYSSVKLQELNPVTVKFTHSAGLGSVPVSDLPNELKDLLAMTSNHDLLDVSLSKESSKSSLSIKALQQRSKAERNYERNVYSVEHQRLLEEASNAEKKARAAESQIQHATVARATLSPQVEKFASDLRYRANQLKAQIALMEAKQLEKEKLLDIEYQKIGK